MHHPGLSQSKRNRDGWIPVKNMLFPKRYCELLPEPGNIPEIEQARTAQGIRKI
ncbi:MAG: hypothetical protein ACI9JL_000734 [Paracoccaceae bacterium]|jgi:hypothetical protein